MFTKNQIDNFIKIYETDENSISISEGSLKSNILMAKMLVDRWGEISTDIIFHPSQKQNFEEAFNSSLHTGYRLEKVNIDYLKTCIEQNSEVEKALDTLIGIQNKPVEMLWGAQIHYSDDCPINHGIMLSSTDGKLTAEIDAPEHAGRSVAVFPVI